MARRLRLCRYCTPILEGVELESVVFTRIMIENASEDLKPYFQYVILQSMTTKTMYLSSINM